MRRIVLLVALAALITATLTLGASGLALAQQPTCTVETVDGTEQFICAGGGPSSDSGPGGGGGRLESTCTVGESGCGAPGTLQQSGGSGGIDPNTGEPGGSGGRLALVTSDPDLVSGTRSGGGSDGSGGRCTFEADSESAEERCTPNAPA